MKVKNINLIKEGEGLRLKAYLPTPNDVWTIGYGHTKGVRPGMVITEQQAEQFLRQDIAWVEEALNRYVTVPLNQNQFDALASWVFNVGAGALKSSTLLKKLNAGDYQGAANELSRWNKQKGRVLTGLTNRRAKERELFLTPVQNSTSKAVGGVTAAAITAAGTLATQDVSVPVIALVGGVVAILGFLFIIFTRKSK